MYVCGVCGQAYDRDGRCDVDGQPLAFTTDPLLGSVLGRHRLARLLGEGGMGRVYLAVQPEIGGRVAIKVLSSHDAEMVDRFFAEARAVNLIHNEHIVDVIDLARLPDGRPYIVMEYVEGQTLGELLRAGPAPFAAIVQWMTEVLSALAAAHAIGIVHRDLKPDNIAISVGGHAKVLDFGIAKLAPSLQGRRAPRTRSGAAVGTPEYMAPEQVTGGEVDARTDIYAAGLVLYEALTGSRPFDGTSDFDVMRAHVEDAPRPPRQLRADLPGALEDVILQAIAKQPEHRFDSATAMANALQHAAAASSLQASRPFVPPPMIHMPATGSPTVPGRTPKRLSPIEAAPNPHPTPDDEPSPAATVSERPPPARQPVAEQGTNAAPARRPSRIARLALWLPLAIVAGGAVFAIAITRGGDGHHAVTAPVATPVIAQAVVPAAAPDAQPLALPVTADAAVAPAPPAPPPQPAVATTPPPPTPRRMTPPPPAPPPAPAPRPPIAVTTTTPPSPSPSLAPTVVPGRFEGAPDYDPDHFDATAYLPKAQAHARELASDAELAWFNVYDVASDGVAKIRHQAANYHFQSASLSGHWGDQRTPCFVTVMADATRLTVMKSDGNQCERPMKPVSLPTCTLAGVWKNAILVGAHPSAVAELKWNGDGRWYFDARGGPDDSFSRTVDDRCGSGLVKVAPQNGQDVYAKRPDYDPHHFDPSAYLARATALIRVLSPDASVTGIEYEHVGRDGHVDLTKMTQRHEYEFRAGNAAGSSCQYWVGTEPGDVRAGAAAYFMQPKHCAPPPAPPRCTFAQIWKRVADVANPDQDAVIQWHEGQWQFEQGGGGSGGVSKKLDDSCP
jgi:serine/threonine protein kinase